MDQSIRHSFPGAIRKSEPGEPRQTGGRFNEFIDDNQQIFVRPEYFGVTPYQGSLNVDVEGGANLQNDLDAGCYRQSS